MKEKFQAVLDNHIKEDAEFWVYFFNEEDGTRTLHKKDKAYVQELFNQVEEVSLHHDFKDVLMVTDKGVFLVDFNENIYYETKDTEGYYEYVSKYNKYHKVYIKLDKEHKTITFKLGDKCKTLELMEHTEFVHKPYKRKYLKCVSAQNLESHMQDAFWNPIMVTVGKKVLGIKDIKVA
ncbi:hypothetical protein PP175_29200 (plasmid) [Aneurinibacillus sp. Ricciae_BoGa-3]|uniref:hypothetical protein n=1 Tax=Aneurinibacillus sp. Ricciae_BoGa-3 TaxID=3022697 RepID=UPI002340F58D|nr:hypothetical protein [Aneurinibacillus sp. Ricciae_BoGa-3]WCK57270.1 hypothetical protein PP175_29200 [Aneurinibacillus sp. Ricciae_BoGa-3]